MVIKQGDLFWIALDDPAGSGPGYKHPHVVVQNNLFNKSRINTTVVCALTSNLRRATAPGNVLLDVGEGNLSKQSVVNINPFAKSGIEDKNRLRVNSTERGHGVKQLSN
jgi:mRNA interferase MazF